MSVVRLSLALALHLVAQLAGGSKLPASQWSISCNELRDFFRPAFPAAAVVNDVIIPMMNESMAALESRATKNATNAKRKMHAARANAT